MKSLFLGGFMATGKSTVGPLAAAKLGLPFVDTDDLVARDAEMSVPDLWRAEGEARFREREAAVVKRCLADGPHVVALGGGALLARELRHEVLDRATLVNLTCDAAEIVRRVGDATKRPNLASAEPLRRVLDLLLARKEAYAECHAELATDGVDPDDVAEAACTVARRDPIVLPLGVRTYAVDVVHDAPETLTDAIARIAPSSIVVVTDAAVRRARGDVLDRALSHLALPRIDVTLPPGETHKTISAVQTIWDAALGAGGAGIAGIDRDALIVAFGGGVTSDLAGFAAATLLRGIDFVVVPTTLLAMVDASVGGKTGFDHPTGKNLVGAIHQPRAVVIDTAHASTLRPRELRAGVAEVVKVALATSAELFARLETNGKAVLDASSPALLATVRDAVTLKARVVRDDERDHGRRALLNLGHTVGHALEAHGGYRKYLHGEAVAIGMCVELRVCVKMGFTPASVAARTRDLLATLGLPTEVTPDELRASLRFVASDKKRRGGRIALPIVTAVGSAEVRDVPPEMLLEA